MTDTTLPVHPPHADLPVDAPSGPRVLSVPCEVHDDARTFSVTFNGAPYFAALSDRELLTFLHRRPDGDYDTDAIAEFMADHDADVHAVMNHRPERQWNGDPNGFECSYDAGRLAALLVQTRPQLTPILAALPELDGPHREQLLNLLSNTVEPTSDAQLRRALTRATDPQVEQPNGTLAALAMTDAADLEIPAVLAVTLTVPLLARLLVTAAQIVALDVRSVTFEAAIDALHPDVEDELKLVRDGSPTWHFTREDLPDTGEWDLRGGHAEVFATHVTFRCSEKYSGAPIRTADIPLRALEEMLTDLIMIA